MPRGYLKEKEYRMTDIRNYISNLMREKKVRQYQLAELLGISPGRMSQKLEACDFDIAELLIIFQRLDADEEKVGKLFIL